MNNEADRRAEALRILPGELKKVIDKFEIQTFISNTVSKLDDFDELIIIGLSAQKLKHNSLLWHQRITFTRSFLKEKALASRNILVAAQVDERYMEYLVRRGQPEEAVTLLGDILQYNMPRNLDEMPQQGEPETESILNVFGWTPEDFFTDSKKNLTEDLACLLIEEGFLEDGAQVAEKRSPIEFYWYYITLVGYLKEHGESAKLRKMRQQIQKEIRQAKQGNEDDDSESQALTKILEKIEEALVYTYIHQDKLQQARKTIDLIENESLRRKVQLGTVTQLFKEGKSQEARAYVHDVLSQAYDVFSNKIEFSLSQEAKQEAYLQLFKVNVELAKTLTEQDQIDQEDLLERCLHGEDSDGQLNLLKILFFTDQSGEEYQANCLLLLEILSKRKDLLRFDNYYLSLEYTDVPTKHLKLSHAKGLFEFDQQKSRSSILSLQDFSQRIDGYIWFVWTSITRKNFHGWEEELNAIFQMEKDDRLQKAEEHGFSDKTSSSTKRSEVLISNLARLAALRGEWDVFKKLLQHQQLADVMQIDLLKDVTNWLVGSKKLEFLPFLDA